LAATPPATIRENLTTLSKEMDCKAIYPDLKFCGDNAAMIAWAGIKRFKKNLIDNIDDKTNQLNNNKFMDKKIDNPNSNKCIKNNNIQ
jgi:tRNA A37 threonylcarbamoyltransferase TsaD